MTNMVCTGDVGTFGSPIWRSGVTGLNSRQSNAWRYVRPSPALDLSLSITFGAAGLQFRWRGVAHKSEHHCLGKCKTLSCRCTQFRAAS
ncbi:MAG: hypothetical protein DMG30_00065 [Acidobacteria bacterium]|nr:MAG: hypothetical protein DMG30_00065 [Acidobacteriota bacterium]